MSVAYTLMYLSYVCVREQGVREGGNLIYGIEYFIYIYLSSRIRDILYLNVDYTMHIIC